MEWAFDSERDPRPSFGEPRVDGSTAAVEYWTAAVDVESRDKSSVTIAGCSLLNFDRDGLVVAQHDYWFSHEGALSPPPEWGS
jgi:hypothetical protein